MSRITIKLTDTKLHKVSVIKKRFAVLGKEYKLFRLIAQHDNSTLKCLRTHKPELEILL